MKVTAELREARRYVFSHGTVLIGQIFNDAKGRWPDGTVVNTSAILTEAGGDLFITRNSSYQVTSWADNNEEKIDG
jgi:hypothetical protein